MRNAGLAAGLTVLAGLLVAGSGAVAGVDRPVAGEPLAKRTLLSVSGAVTINGRQLVVSGQGAIDPASGSYTFSSLRTTASACPADRALAVWFPRAALGFLVRIKGVSLLELAGGDLRLSLKGAPKRDLTSNFNRLFGTVDVRGTAARAGVRVDGVIETSPGPCRRLEAEREGSAMGHSVVRLGIKRTVAGGRFTGGSFVGVGRLDFDVAKGDPEALGGSDFWNLDGVFSAPRAPRDRPGACSQTSCAVVSVGVGHLLGAARAAGKVSNFPSSTATHRAVLTYDEVAASDGVFHKHIGIANVAGGSPLLAHFDIPVQKGDTPQVLAARTAALINRSKAGVGGGGALLAVQGGTGVGVQVPNRESPRVAICQTRDGKSCVVASDKAAQRVFPQVGTQVFASHGIHAFLNPRMRETFGVLNEPPLVGWLTPFKVVFYTDNPATGYAAAGGTVVVGANICASRRGAFCDPGTTTSVPLFRIDTAPGQTGEDIARAVVRALEAKGVTCIQRIGPTVIMDAGLEMPSVLHVKSEDTGVGYATQAADIPTLADPH